MMRWILVAMVSLGLLGPLQAQDEWYRASEREYNQLDVNGRLLFQFMLTAAGPLQAVPNIAYNSRIDAAIKDFQRSLRHPATGYLTEDQMAHLVRVALPVIKGWDMSEMRHPVRGHKILVPYALGLEVQRTAEGVLVREKQNRFRLKYEYFPVANVRASFDATLREMRGSGDTILFDVIRDDFFAISGHQGRYHRYVRYHRDGTGLIGFDMNWSTEEAPIHGARLATVISGSLWAAMTAAPTLPADPLTFPWDRSEPNMASAAPPTYSSPGYPTPAVPERRQGGSSSGTGFYVSHQGHVVTNNHVVESCSRITVRVDAARSLPASILARTSEDDLALLKVDHHPGHVGGIRVGMRLGEPVAVFGFPLTDVLSSSGNFTLGNITALSGIGDDPRFLQVSAPVQKGNSGGPLLDENGNIVGVVTGKLNALKSAASSGDIPQNVNFAVKSTVLSHFLDMNRVGYVTGNLTNALKPADLAEKARDMSVQVVCH
jgi:serine protease Do